jgi:N-acetyl sugar amidotransferase
MDHPLGLTLNSDGICSGCTVHKERIELDWDWRWQLLRKVVEPYRSTQGAYDVIVPVTGGGDAFFTLHLVKKLGLNPLGVHFNSHLNTRIGLRNLAKLRDAFDLDILTFTAKPSTVKRVVAESMVQLGSVWWHVIAGQTALAAQIAVKRAIPLVIWGCHQGVEQVGMFSHLTAPEMTSRYRREHDLMGYDIMELGGGYSSIREEDLLNYRYPDDSDLLQLGFRGIYLSNYYPWDSLRQNALMHSMYGYLGCQVQRSFDPFEHIDSIAYMGIHDALKFAKHGYGKVTDQAVREIRHGRMSRLEAQTMAKRHATSGIPWFQEFTEWLGANPRAIQLLLSKLDSFKGDPESWSRVRPTDRILDFTASNLMGQFGLDHGKISSPHEGWLDGPFTFHRGAPY